MHYCLVLTYWSVCQKLNHISSVQLRCSVHTFTAYLMSDELNLQMGIEPAYLSSGSVRLLLKFGFVRVRLVLQFGFGLVSLVFV